MLTALLSRLVRNAASAAGPRRLASSWQTSTITVAGISSGPGWVRSRVTQSAWRRSREFAPATSGPVSSSSISSSRRGAGDLGQDLLGPLSQVRLGLDDPDEAQLAGQRFGRRRAHELHDDGAHGVGLRGAELVDQLMQVRMLVCRGHELKYPLQLQASVNAPTEHGLVLVPL